MAKKKEAVEEVAVPTIDTIMAEINKEFGESIIGRVGDFDVEDVPRLTTGIEKLDAAAGGGFPLGKIVEFFGQPSSGKSLTSLLLIAEAQRRGLESIYIDCEASFDATFAKALGADPDKMILIQTAMGEDIFNMMKKLLEINPGIIVVDSVGAMLTRQEMEEDIDKALMAPKARFMSRMLPILNQINQDTLIVFINQQRSNITPMGTFGSTTPGGKALAYYSSIRVEFKTDTNNFLHPEGQKGGKIIGQVIQFNFRKNKTARPHETGSIRFYYDGPRFA